MMEITDEQIVQKVQKGDTQSFGLLIGRYEQKLLRYARKFIFDSEEAKDLVQEVFMKAYINIRGSHRHASNDAKHVTCHA